MAARKRPKRSAGILVYRLHAAKLDLLLIHPGGPFWARKDAGAWFIPKGEINPDEEPRAAAYREFGEELGLPAPPGEPLELGVVKNKGGKLIHAWALPGDLDLAGFKSNSFELEWPPRSGQLRQFPEVDRAAYFTLEEALQKMHPAEVPLIERLLQLLGQQARAVQIPGG